MNCPCHSGKPYQECCAPYHQHLMTPPTAEALMRSRYSAYALKLPDYILATTHPKNPHTGTRESILEFCENTLFEDLTILAFADTRPYAYVTFHAKLSQDGHDVSFTEKSQFEQISGRWLYLNGEKK